MEAGYEPTELSSMAYKAFGDAKAFVCVMEKVVLDPLNGCMSQASLVTDQMAGIIMQCFLV